MVFIVRAGIQITVTKCLGAITMAKHASEAESRRRNAYLEALSHIQSDIANQQTLDRILDKVIQSVIDILGEAGCAIFLLEPVGQTLTCRASKGILCSEYDRATLNGKQSLAEHVLQTRKIEAIADYRNDSSQCLLTLENGRIPGAAAAAPIIVGHDRIIGALVAYSEEPRDLEEEELGTLSTLAESVGVSVVNSDSSAECERQRTWVDAVLRAVPSAILISRKPQDRLELANEAAEELLGQKLETGTPLTEIPKKYGIFELNGSPIAIDRFPLYRASAYGKASDLVEMLVIRPDGERRIIQGNAVPMYDRSGNVSGAVAELEDITRLKSTQTALKKALSKQRYLADTLQKALIPNFPERTGGLLIGRAYAGAFAEDYMGGDFFDVFYPNAEQVSIAVGDVSGKGVTAAVLTALVRYTLRAYGYEDASPKRLIEKLNDVVASEVSPDEFATVFYGLWDVKLHSLGFVNAGHEPPLYLASSESEAKELPLSGLPVGAVSGALYREHSLRLSSGDRLLLYTDGVTEARGDKDFFGVPALKDFFAANRRASPGEFTAQLMDHLRSYSNGHLRDDVAILLISVS